MRCAVIFVCARRPSSPSRTSRSPRALHTTPCACSVVALYSVVALTPCVSALQGPKVRFPRCGPPATPRSSQSLSPRPFLRFLAAFSFSYRCRARTATVTSRGRTISRRVRGFTPCMRPKWAQLLSAVTRRAFSCRYSRGWCLARAVKAAWRLWDARNIMAAPTKTERSALIVKLCLDVARDFV